MKEPYIRNPHRRWALARIKTCRDENACKCWKPDCVACAYEMGRRVGQVEAGAYYTASEVFGRKEWADAKKKADKRAKKK